MSKKYDLTHVRHDPAYCLAPGLFRCLKRGDYKRIKLDVTYQFNDDISLRFTGFEPMGAQELRLLQVLVAMAGPSRLLLDLEAPVTEVGQQLALLLQPPKPKGRARKDSEPQPPSGMVKVVESTMYKVLKEMGLEDTGPNRKAVLTWLHRLANVTVLANSGGKVWTMKILSYYVDQSPSGGIDGYMHIALDSRMTRAVTGGQYVRIDMNEIRAIKIDATRLIHQRLCAWINQGDTKTIDIDTLCSYAWPDGQQPKQTDEQWWEVVKKRRQTLQKVLAELNALGWRCMAYGRERIKITRVKSEEVVLEETKGSVATV